MRAFTASPTVRQRLIGGIAASLLLVGAAACGSDKKAATTTAAAVDTTGASAATNDTTPDTAAAPDTVAADTGGGTGNLDAQRNLIVDFSIEQAAVGGFTLDRGCLEALAVQLSDEDAALLAASAQAGGEDDPELSPAGEALGEQLIGCAVTDADPALQEAAVDAVMASSDGATLERPCVENAFKILNTEQLQSVIDDLATNNTTQSSDPKLQFVAFALLNCVIGS